MRVSLVLLGWAFCFAASPAWARWATPEDMDASVEYQNWDIQVHQDGTYDEEIDSEVLILKESGRMSRGVLRLNYNPEVSRFEVLSAETIHGKTRLAVSPELIEDKPLASSGEGFDQWHQIMIAFPGVDVGSRLHLKLRTKWTHVPAPGFFSSQFFFGSELQKKGRIVLRSELPLFTEINDPRKELKISQDPHRIEVILKKPVLRTTVDEREPMVDPSELASIQVATSRSWADLPKTVLDRYEEIVSAPLPKPFEKIADQARAISDPVARMNAVTSLLADKIRYLGDWRTLKGQWIPRPLATIAGTKFGDCKDFAVSITAILRKLGMQARVAWVARGWRPVMDSYKLPSTFRFNHAIAQVKVGDKTYWLDGTNVASFAQGIPGDISDRPALVLDAKMPALTQIPASPPGDFAYSFFQQLDFSGKDGIRVDAKFKTRGGDAAAWINSHYSDSQDTLDFKVVRAVARSEQIHDWKVSGFKLNSRIAGELSAELHYTDKTEGYRSTAGMSYPLLTPDALDRFLFPADRRVSAMYIGEPFAYQREMLFTHLTIVGKESLNCSVDTPWISVSRKVKDATGGFRILDKLMLKKALIRPQEFGTRQFGGLQKKLARCFQYSSLIYQPQKPQLD